MQQTFEQALADNRDRWETHPLPAMDPYVIPESTALAYFNETGYIPAYVYVYRPISVQTNATHLVGTRRPPNRAERRRMMRGK